jgi:hypothetical protein
MSADVPERPSRCAYRTGDGAQACPEGQAAEGGAAVLISYVKHILPSGCASALSRWSVKSE